GGGREPREDFASFRTREVDRCRALPDVVVPEVKAPVRMRIVTVEGTDPPARAPPRRFELHHLGSHAGEETACALPALVGHLDDAEVCQATPHASPPAPVSATISASARPSRSRRTACVSSPRQGGPRRMAPPGWTSPSESRKGGRSSGQSPVSACRRGTK